MSQQSFCSIIDLPLIHDPRGDLTFYLYNVPVDAKRGGHAHRTLEQVIFALSGSFRVKVDDGKHKTEYWLRNPRQGLYLKNLVWRESGAFSQGAVCMVLASNPYDERDYIRSYDQFLAEIQKQKSKP